MSDSESAPQENVPFAIRDIAANEPAQTFPPCPVRLVVESHRRKLDEWAQQIVEAERARIVAWLRCNDAYQVAVQGHGAPEESLADAIERGDHAK